MHDYKLTRKKGLKRINLRVNTQGEVVVTAPKHIPKLEINRFVASSEDWINKRLSSLTLVSFDDDSELGCLGLKNIEGSNYIYDSAAKVLSLNLNQADVSGVIYSFVRTKAVEALPLLIKQIADTQSLDVNKVTVKNVSSRWGSCSSKGNINLSISVWLLPYELQHYVISHELAHLKHLNHSRDFWNYVSEMHPEYKVSRKAIRNYQHLLGIFKS